MNSTLSDADIQKIAAIKINYDDVVQFLHCADCLNKFLGGPSHKTMSPGDAMQYETGSVHITYPDGKKIGIIAIFCKHCHKHVWDSRHLQPLY